MPEQKDPPPAEITNALAALNQLRADQPGADISELARTLPPLAKKLALHQQDISTAALLGHARQGVEHIRELYASLESAKKERTYEKIVMSFPGMTEMPRHEVHSRLTGIREREQKYPYPGINIDNILSLPDEPGPFGRKTSHRLAQAAEGAAEHGDLDGTMGLIEAGLDPQYFNQMLAKAALYGHSEVMRVYLERGANPNMPSSHTGSLLSHCTALCIRNSVQMLLDFDAVITEETIKCAVEHNAPDLLSAFEKKGADLSCLTEEQKGKVDFYKKWNEVFPHLSRESLQLPIDTWGHQAFFSDCDLENKQDREVISVSLMLAHEMHINETHRSAEYAVKLFDTSDRILRYLEKWGKAGKQPLHDIIHMIQIPNNPPDLTAWKEAVLQQGPAMARLVKFSDRLPQPKKNEQGTYWSLVKTREAIAAFTYTRGKEQPELAALGLTCQWTERQFEDAYETVIAYQEKYAANDNKKPAGIIPDITIKGEDIGKEGYTFHRLPDGDIKGLALGDFTDCCQHIGGPGAECAKHGFLSPHGGFYVLTEDKAHEIVAQSWAWRGTQNELVLDSLEYLRGRINTEQAGKLCRLFAQEARKCGIETIRIGTGGKTPHMGFEVASQPATPVDCKRYGDSSQQYVLTPRR